MLLTMLLFNIINITFMKQSPCSSKQPDPFFSKGTKKVSQMPVKD